MENITNYHNAENPLIFHHFDGQYHAHFHAIYGMIGKKDPLFGGNQKGAIYIYPTAIEGEDVVCVIRARGCFKKEYHGTTQKIPKNVCIFVEEGVDVTAEKATAETIWSLVVEKGFYFNRDGTVQSSHEDWDSKPIGTWDSRTTFRANQDVRVVVKALAFKDRVWVSLKKGRRYQVELFSDKLRRIS